MKRFLSLSILLLAGCGQEAASKRPANVAKPVNNDLLKVYSVKSGDYYYLLELKYGGKIHMFLHHNQANRSSMVKIGERPITEND